MDKVKETLSSTTIRTKLKEIGFSYDATPTDDTVKKLRQFIVSLRNSIPKERLERYGIPGVNKILFEKESLDYFTRFATVETEPL